MKSQSIRIVSFIAAIVFAFPIPFGLFTGFYLWVSPFIFLNSILSVRAIVAFHLLGLAALVLIVWQNRWFCRNLCPTGVLFDAVSSVGWKRQAWRRIASLGRPLCAIALIAAAFGVPILMLLDPISILYAFVDGFQAQDSSIRWVKISGLALLVSINFTIPHIWCRRLCPLGGLQNLCADMRSAFKRWIVAPPHHRVWLARRIFITGTIGAGFGLFVQRLAKANTPVVLRPPGTLPESQFKTVCIRCGNCVRACPADILKPSLDANDWIGALTPQILFIDSYCLPECVQCGRVCPSGAISYFSQAEKKYRTIGIARIRTMDCMLVNNRECDQCKAYCTYDAIEIHKSEKDYSVYPFVVKDRCVGCGACKIVCPVEAIAIVRV